MRLGRIILVGAAAIGLSAGCASASAEPVSSEGAPEVTASTKPASPPPQLTPEEWAALGETGFPVGDESGQRGTVTQAELDAQTARVEQRLLEEGAGVDGATIPAREVPAEVREAYHVLEAIEVRDGDEVVGYWTTFFVPAEEYPEERARAEALVAGAEG